MNKKAKSTTATLPKRKGKPLRPHTRRSPKTGVRHMAGQRVVNHRYVITHVPSSELALHMGIGGRQIAVFAINKGGDYIWGVPVGWNSPTSGGIGELVTIGDHGLVRKQVTQVKDGLEAYHILNSTHLVNYKNDKQEMSSGKGSSYLGMRPVFEMERKGHKAELWSDNLGYTLTIDGSTRMKYASRRGAVEDAKKDANRLLEGMK